VCANFNKQTQRKWKIKQNHLAKAMATNQQKKKQNEIKGKKRKKIKRRQKKRWVK